MYEVRNSAGEVVAEKAQQNWAILAAKHFFEETGEDATVYYNGRVVLVYPDQAR
jgi:hypothetical protein